MPKFQELEISNFSGLQSSNRLPDKSAAQTLLNLDVRGKKGDLEVRNGYAQLYGKPEDTAIARGYFTAIDYLGVENFVVPSPLTEVTVEVAKGSLALLSGSNLVVDGAFDVDPNTNWNVTDASITFPVGHAGFTNTPNGSILSAAVAPLTAGQKYRLTFNIADRSAGGVEIYLTSPLNYDGNIATSTMNWTTNGNHCVDFTCSAGEEAINFRAFGAGTSNTFKLTNVVIYLLSEIKMPLVFASHTGSALSVAWDNLTKTYSTIISSVGTTTNKYKIVLQSTLETYPGSAVHPTASNALAGWIIYNITKSDYAQIITSGTDTNGVYISKLYHTWAANDVILIMRSFIPYEYLSEMGTNVLAADVVFHKVLNDLVIGYGGQANRISLTVGFRQDYLNIGSCSFGFTEADIKTATRNNGLVLATYYPEKSKVDIELSAIADTTTALTAETYSVKAVLETDGYNLYDFINPSSLTIGASESLGYIPKIRLGTDSRFLSNIYFYIKSSTSDYNLFTTLPYRSTVHIPTYVLSGDGQLILVNATERHTELGNAAGWATTGEDADTTGWAVFEGVMGTEVLAPFNDIAPDNLSDHSIELYMGGTPPTLTSVRMVKARYLLSGVKLDSVLNIALVARCNVASGYDIAIYIGDVDGNDKSLDADSSLAANYGTTKTAQLTITGAASAYYIYLVFHAYTDFTYTEKFYFDLLTITEAVSVNQPIFDAVSTELSNDLGYVSTGLYAKSWDLAKVSAGKTILLNPYFEKRYLNNPFFSPLSGSGSPMYAVITPANYHTLENFDGNDVVGLEVLPNMDFLVLRRNGTQMLDPETGAVRNVELGKGCISRASIVNYGDKIIWCGENDIHLSNGVEVIDITDGTIRTAYRSITDKTALVATREERDNAYRFYNGLTGATTKLEYIFTKKGWITARRANIPNKYALSKDGTVFFMKTGTSSAGVVYKDSGDTLHNDSGTVITFKWKSVPIDIDLLGEGLSNNVRFFLNSLYARIIPLAMTTGAVTLDIYYDTNADHDNAADQQISPTNENYSRKLVLRGSCKKFALGISGTLGGTDQKLSLGSIGVTYKLLPVGRWAND